jgi:hypothetical protein
VGIARILRTKLVLIALVAVSAATCLAENSNKPAAYTLAPTSTASTVPEPTAWGMLVAGVFLVLIAGTRRTSRRSAGSR